MILPSRPAIPFARPVSLFRLYPSTPTLARYSSEAQISPVISQLRRVATLQKRVGATNSNIEKQRIIAEYPELRTLLEQVYHPKFRSHLSSASLDKCLLSSPSTPKNPSSPSDDIVSLFEKLSTRSVTGNAAKDLTRAFLVENGVLAGDGTGVCGGKEELEVFKRLIDRNLVAGFGARTLSEINWGGETDNEKATAVLAGGGGSGQPQIVSTEIEAASNSISTPKRKSMKAFSCALGKTIIPSHLHTLFTSSSPKWYASRKLDGVRVITYLDFHLAPNSPSLTILGIQHLSRTGNTFTSLGHLAPQLEAIASYPGLVDILKDEAYSLPSEEDKGNGQIRRLVLDGEVCVMRPGIPSADDPVDPPSTTDSVHPLWSGDSNLVEDFTATVSEIRRQNHTIAHPGYYLFDILYWSDFNGGVSGSERKTFSKRISELKDLGIWLGSELEDRGLPNGIKVLEQVEVGGAKDIEGMVEIAAERGWEGLVLRADKPYKGSRSSSDVRKFKQWQDAEYTVRDIELSGQRLSINGVFAEYDAIAALVFDHKGHPVSVSSGMTAEQRVKWAKDPSLIIGKQMTVEYFSESEAIGREGVRSLRFPRIKTFWEGKRDI